MKNNFKILILISVALFLCLFPTTMSEANTDSPTSSVNTSSVTPEQYERNIEGVKKITYYQYNELMHDNNGKFYVFIGYSGCQYCRMFSPQLRMFIRDSALKIYYLDLDSSFDNVPDAEIPAFKDSFKAPFSFKGTPTVLAISQGKIIDSVGGGNATFRDLAYMKSALIATPFVER